MRQLFNLLTGCFLMTSSLCLGQKFQVDTLQKTGPLAKRINVVILGDGFTQDELPKFDQEAQKIMNFFLGYTPYNAYKNYFNFFSIRVPSNQSGATNPGTAPDRYPNQPIETKDTYFGSSFGTANIHRLVAIRNYQAFTNVMATNFPSYDLAIMIVNSPWYGGSGGNPATFTLDAQASLIGMHEIGHLFTSLTDEYWAGAVYAREAANMTQNTNPATITWKNWLNQFNIGIFQHLDNAVAQSWYKPTNHNCLMEQLDRSFCAVCREATTNRILQLVKSVDGVSPLPSSRITVNTQPVTIQLTLLKPNPNTLAVDWRLNNLPFKQNTDQVTLSADQLPNQTNTLSVTVLDTTDFIRLASHPQQHRYTYQWTLERDAPAQTMTLSTSRNSLCIGESAILTASNCSGSVTWSTGVASTSIAVSPTQSTTYTAMCTIAGTSSQTASISLAVFPLPTAEASNTGPYLENQTIQLTAKGGTRYAWAGPANFTSSEQNPAIPAAKASQSGAYTVTVSSTNGCSDKAQTVVIVNPLLSVTSPSADAVWVFPNPAKEQVFIRSALSGELTFTLFDAKGNDVLKKSFYESTEFRTDKLVKSVYFYRVSNGQQILTGKLIIE